MIALNQTRNEQVNCMYLTDVEILCVDCHRPIKARINTQQWIRVEWIGPSGECQRCYQAKREQGKER